MALPLISPSYIQSYLKQAAFFFPKESEGYAGTLLPAHSTDLSEVGQPAMCSKQHFNVCSTNVWYNY